MDRYLKVLAALTIGLHYDQAGLIVIHSGDARAVKLSHGQPSP